MDFNPGFIRSRRRRYDFELCLFPGITPTPIDYILSVLNFLGSCSPAKIAECEALWRTCQNGQCGECLLEIEGECYGKSFLDLFVSNVIILQ